MRPRPLLGVPRRQQDLQSASGRIGRGGAGAQGLVFEAWGKDMRVGCTRLLADGQWWNYCGESDMGQTTPVLCTVCSGKYGFIILDETKDQRAEVLGANTRRKEAGDRWEAAGYVGCLDDY